jgi:GntR family transcriptional regulator
VNVDPRSHVPIYLQIADGIREAVAAGIFRPGDAVPSLRVMALQVQVNPNTVQRAYEQLAREGVIYARRGRGLFVADQAASSAQTRARESIRCDFEKAICTGRAVGLTTDELRRIFEASIVGHGHVGTEQ